MERLIEGEVRKRLDKYVNNSETFDIHNGNEFTLNNVTLKQEFAKTLFRSVVQPGDSLIVDRLVAYAGGVTENHNIVSYKGYSDNDYLNY